MNSTVSKAAGYLFLAVVCAASIAIAAPTIAFNVGAPNMVVYFNHDEGGIMDLVWSYYSGVRRPSFQWDCDYGLFTLYLTDICRIFFSRVVAFTPGTFVLILRWIYLLAWVASLVALWNLVGRHFRRQWQQVAVVALVAVRPAFPYLLNNLKPDPLLLLVMILGLDHTLRIAEGPAHVKNFWIAAACASIASLIKYAGVFLLPAIMLAMHLANRQNENVKGGKRIFPLLRIAYLLPAAVGLAVLALLFGAIFFYERKCTGHTWFVDYGAWGSLARNPILVCIAAGGLALMAISVAAGLLRNSRNALLRKADALFIEVNSYALLACGAFALCTVCFGLRWIVRPMDFILTYVPLGTFAVHGKGVMMAAKQGFAVSFIRNTWEKICVFDPLVLLLFIGYCAAEARSFTANLRAGSVLFYKRCVLCAFIAPAFAYYFSMLMVAQHHILPFFAALCALTVQGIGMLAEWAGSRKLARAGIIAAAAAILAFDIGQNGLAMVQARIRSYYRREDVAFELAEWWRANIPLDAKIVAEHYSQVYVPDEYKNVRIFRRWESDRVATLRKLVAEYRPEYIYYNIGPADVNQLPPLEEMLPDSKFELVKRFDNSGRDHCKRQTDVFVIYRIRR